MPKIKTNKAIAKRFKRTASGKLKAAHAKTSHRFHGKTKKERRQLRRTHMVNKTVSNKYNQLMHK